MTQFWMYAALLCAVAIAIVCWPRRRPRLVDREATNVALYRQRIEELSREHGEGRLSDQELATLKDELAASLLLDADGAGVSTASTGNIIDRRAVFIVAALVPLIAFVGYRQLGSIDDVEIAKGTKALVAAEAAPAGADAAHAGADLKSLADKLEARLATKPSDPDGWFLLGRTAVDLQEYARAANAYEKLAALVPTEAVPLIYQAQAQFMQHDRHVTPDVKATIDRALALSPGDPSALELLAVDAFERKDYRATLDYLNQGIAHDMPPEQRAYFSQGIAKTRELLGLPPVPQGAAAMPAGAITRAASPGSNALANGAAGPAIDVAVNVAPGVTIPPGTTIFVVAKAVAGPPMPLAVQRRTAADLPFKVRLDASSAMSPALTIASVDQVIVSARASRRGTPEHAPDDIEIHSAPLHVGTQAIGLTLTLGGEASVTTTTAASVASTPRGTIVRVLVELGADVHVPPTTPVFVFAREAGGPRMPIAVRRMTVADLPTIVVLDDTSAMQPQRNLSSVGRVEIVARVAKSGGVVPTRGDIEGQSAVIAPRKVKQVVSVLVDKVLP